MIPNANKAALFYLQKLKLKELPFKFLNLPSFLARREVIDFED
jgi:hypothetical protein